MHKFVIPALDLLYGWVQKGFSRRQKILAGLMGLIILASFMFRAACPPEQRFFRSPRSGTIDVCAPADIVKNAVPLGHSRSAKVGGEKPQPFRL